MFAINSFQPLFAQQDSTVITINAKKVIGPFEPIWSYFGHDEANYSTRKDGKKLLTELAALRTYPVYLRVHNLLITGDGSLLVII